MYNDPTLQDYLNPYEVDPYSGNLSPIPTPPTPGWKPKQRHRRLWLLFVLFALVVIIAGFFATIKGLSYWSSTYQISIKPKATLQPTTNPNYTVTDIVTAMKKDGCPCGKYIACPDGGNYGSPVVCQSGDNKLIYGTSIGNAFGSDYAIGIQAADSALWPDPSMDLQWDSVGLWVYNTPMDAQSAFSEVNTQIGAEQSAITQSSTIPIARLHGRCLLLVAPEPGQWSGYQQALDKYCV